MRLDISQQDIIIDKDGYYEIYGTTFENNISINAKATILLDNVDISLKDKSKAAIQLGEFSNINLIIRGDNFLRSGDNYAGIQMNKMCSLIVEGEDISSILNIESGTSGAGIGSGDGEDYIGDITINSGNINIIATREGAGIGGGNGGNGGGNFLGTLTIEGGYITIIRGDAGGAGIGGGANGNLDGYIEINNGQIEIKECEDGVGAGIGGGYDANFGGDIVINNGQITVLQSKGVAGIGGGLGVNNGGNFTGSITVNGGSIISNGGVYRSDFAGAGIGGGYNGSMSGRINLNAGTITAKGPGSANDIGAGSDGVVTGNVNIQIESIDIIPTYMNLDIGESKKVTTTVSLVANIDARISDYDKVTYMSEDTSIATVDKDGLVKGESEGQTNIVAVCEADKSKVARCKINVNKEIINIGDIDLLIKVDKKTLKEENIPEIICYGNNPVIMNYKTSSELAQREEKIYMYDCNETIDVKVEYKKTDIYLDILYSIVLFTTDDCLNGIKIYAMENSSNMSCVSFCLSKDEQIDINRFTLKIYPKYEIDKNYSDKYYLFKVSGYIGLITS